MAVKIRLARTGRKKIMTYRIVAAESSQKRDGRFLETIGTYNPQTEPKQFTMDVERVSYWIAKGAQPTLTVRNLLKQDRFFERVEAAAKGLSPEEANIARSPERKRKPKAAKAKKK